jgi:hypothetical protein
MPPGSAFVHEMDKAVEENEGLVAVLSPDYLKSPHCESEWQAFYQKDPNGEKRALIPVRVRECQPKGLLAQRVYIRELQRRRELRELARVPGLLGFILQLWRRRGSVTDDKLELYEQITFDLARHLDTDKEGVQPDRKWLVKDEDGSLKLDLLRQLAFNQLFKGLVRPTYDIGSTDNDVNRLIFTSE